MSVSLPVRDGFKYQIKPDRVRSLRREFLASHGIDVRSSKTERAEFGQHSIRGASVALLDMYIDKTEIIAKLGDWDRYDTFLNYYYKLHADRSWHAQLGRVVSWCCGLSATEAIRGVYQGAVW